MSRVVERLKNAAQAFTLLDEEARQRDAALAARRAEADEAAGRLQRLLQGRVEKGSSRKTPAG
jgi:hypothetical protein